MNKEEVINLMKSSKNANEWNKNCTIVKEKCNGYPNFWYETIIVSGIAREILGDDSVPKIVKL